MSSDNKEQQHKTRFILINKTSNKKESLSFQWMNERESCFQSENKIKSKIRTQ